MPLEHELWDYVIGSWRTMIPSPWGEIAMALMSVLCGAIVGIEREKKEKPAGLRTLVLVCLGSAVFTMVSYAFITTTGDSGRVAAQIVTGIGFLGAGVILHSGGMVTGATTAATVWMTAAMGMTIGTGHAMAGLGLSALTRAALTGIYWWESRTIEDMQAAAAEVIFDPDHGKTRIRIAKVMEDFHVTHPARDMESMPGGALRLRILYHLPRRQRREFLNELALMKEVREIREQSDEEAQSE
jgi:putative Mg2+ transporter-C (MgtC) family protein